MVKNGEITLPDAKRVLRKFWWILPITVVVGLTGALVALKVLPKRYTSQTVVLVDPQSVSSAVVPPVVAENLAPRLASMQQQILSRTRLEPLITRFDLYGKDRAKISMDELVVRLQKSIEVVPMEPMSGTSRQLPGFSVQVTFGDPIHAQQICGEITSMFISENSKARVEQGQQTTSFLTTELEDAKRKLDAQDAALAQFKQRYLGSLPDQEQANLSMLMGMNSQLDANTQALSRAQQDRAFNQALLAQQEATIKAANATSSGQSPETIDQRLAVLQDQLAALRARYTDEHPDVVKLKSQIADLKSQLAAEPQPAIKAPADRPSAVESPQMQQLRAKLHQDDLNIADLTKREGQIQEQIRMLQGRIQSSPAVEQKYKELTRNYQTALDFYNTLLKNREQAAMATNLEQRQEGEQFRVLDPPSLPDKPSSPKKPVILGGGFGGGLALGAGILLLIALNDRSIYTEHDVESCLKMPVLASIPVLNGLVQRSTDNAKAGPRLDAA